MKGLEFELGEQGREIKQASEGDNLCHQAARRCTASLTIPSLPTVEPSGEVWKRVKSSGRGAREEGLVSLSYFGKLYLNNPNYDRFDKNNPRY